MQIDYNEPVKYLGKQNVNIDYHHGQLRPAIGVNSIQVLRANREHPDEAEGTGWTYNHAPMLTFHNGKFYLEYLSNPFEEHLPPGHTLVSISKDGICWSKPEVVFPVYKIPDGIFKYDNKKLPSNSYAVMHQRMGFYSAPNGKLLVLGNYGISPEVNQVPFGRFGIGRVVREIFADDTFGPIYFIRYNKGTIWDFSNTLYPYYKSSESEKFIEACEMLLAEPLVTQQWAEEQGDQDELITVKSQDGGAFFNKAFCSYKLPNGAVLGLWKWMKCAVSHDDGKSWSKVTSIPTIRHSGSKIWGQRTSDGRYALVYNPHTNNVYRWPLAVVTGDDGLSFDKMMCVAGDLSPMRYIGGPFKDLGFNYVRGIENPERMGPDGAMYVVYSVNKEDIWISRIPVPVKDFCTENIYEDFNEQQEDSWIEGWNIYCPKWAPVKVAKIPGKDSKCMIIKDFDPYDYAKAEKIFKEGKKVDIKIRILAVQNEHGNLFIELCDARGSTPFKLIFAPKGELMIVHGRKNQKYFQYEAGKWYDINISVDVYNNSFDVEINGDYLSLSQFYQGQGTSMKGWFFASPVDSLERIVFRTGPFRREPDTDTIWSDGNDLVFPGLRSDVAEFHLDSISIVSEWI